MKKYVFLVFVLFSSLIFGQSRIRAKQYASEYAGKLMDEWGSSKAKNLNHEITDIEIDGSTFVIEMDVNWDDKEGVIVIDDAHCQIKGVLTVNFDGTNPKWQESYRNEGIKLVAKSKTNNRNWGNIAAKATEKLLENNNR
ncbi:hypothetical protein H9Q08_17465 [Chryseobacterium sp. PS-8]|uniref:DUF4468 domain-containing protein n=1 Tax=Chryseobacterium indicum TaxID=2766954 RepID=A0ABS9C9T5_9FLAO|nr:hypothetical protein [Chryseobacterium sp. PS-8]MCF2221078.1 hypothetical protein [Chryseobacterium sp. PS-8]